MGCIWQRAKPCLKNDVSGRIFITKTEPVLGRLHISKLPADETRVLREPATLLRRFTRSNGRRKSRTTFQRFVAVTGVGNVPFKMRLRVSRVNLCKIYNSGIEIC